MRGHRVLLCLNNSAATPMGSVRGNNPVALEKELAPSRPADPTLSPQARFQQFLKDRGTPQERFAIQYLTSHRFKFVYQKIIHFYFVDFYFPDRGLILELDGHGHNKRQAEDFIRDHRLKKATEGCYIIHRMKNSEVTVDYLDHLFQEFPIHKIDKRLERRIARRNPKGWKKELLRRKRHTHYFGPGVRADKLSRVSLVSETGSYSLAQVTRRSGGRSAFFMPLPRLAASRKACDTSGQSTDFPARRGGAFCFWRNKGGLNAHQS